MVWIAFILAVFFFYRFVERKHKIVFFKTVGCLLILGIVGIGGYVWYSDWEYKNRKTWIEITFTWNDIPNGHEKNQIVDKAYHAILPSVFEQFKGLKTEDLARIKATLFRHWVDIRTRQSDEYDVLISDEEVDLIIASDKKEKNIAQQKIEKKLKEIKSDRMKRYITSYPDLRKRSETGLNRFLLASYLEKIDFDDSETGKEFDAILNTEDREIREAYKKLRKAARESVHNLANEQQQLQTMLSFEICNRRDRPLNSYSFYVSGMEEGRSKQHDLRKTSGYGGSMTDFEGDIIIKPKECQVIQWTGPYKFFDKNEVSLITGHWDER